MGRKLATAEAASMQYDFQLKVLKLLLFVHK